MERLTLAYMRQQNVHAEVIGLLLRVNDSSVDLNHSQLLIFQLQ